MTKRAAPGSTPIVRLMVGALLIGALMAARMALEEFWARVALAACAGGVLGWMLTVARKSRM